VRTRASSPGGTLIESGLFANRPAAGIVGRYYYATDVYYLFRDNGVTWDIIGGYFRRYFNNIDILVHADMISAVFVVGVVRLSRFEVQHTITIDQLIYNVGAGSAGNVRMGIYAQGGADIPDGGALLAEAGPVAQAAANTPQFLGIANTRLTPGAYWIGIQGDNAVGSHIRLGHAIPVQPARSQTFNQAFGAFTNPCPATIAGGAGPFVAVRILSIP